MLKKWEGGGGGVDPLALLQQVADGEGVRQAGEGGGAQPGMLQRAQQLLRCPDLRMRSPMAWAELVVVTGVLCNISGSRHCHCIPLPHPPPFSQAP